MPHERLPPHPDRAPVPLGHLHLPRGPVGGRGRGRTAGAGRAGAPGGRRGAGHGSPPVPDLRAGPGRILRLQLGRPGGLPGRLARTGPRQPGRRRRHRRCRSAPACRLPGGAGLGLVRGGVAGQLHGRRRWRTVRRLDPLRPALRPPPRPHTGRRIRGAGGRARRRVRGGGRWEAAPDVERRRHLGRGRGLAAGRGPGPVVRSHSRWWATRRTSVLGDRGAGGLVAGQ